MRALDASQRIEQGSEAFDPVERILVAAAAGEAEFTGLDGEGGTECCVMQNSPMSGDRPTPVAWLSGRPQRCIQVPTPWFRLFRVLVHGGEWLPRGYGSPRGIKKCTGGLRPTGTRFLDAPKRVLQAVQHRVHGADGRCAFRKLRRFLSIELVVHDGLPTVGANHHGYAHADI